MRRHPLQQRGCSLLRGHIVRDTNEARCRGCDQLGIRTGDAVEGDTVPDLKRCDAFADLYNSTSGLATDGHRQRRRDGVPPLVHFGEVQADGLDLDDRLTNPRFRIRDILVDQAFWPACLVYAYCFHGNPP